MTYNEFRKCKQCGRLFIGSPDNPLCKYCWDMKGKSPLDLLTEEKKTNG